jgi:hypothetical protein
MNQCDGCRRGLPVKNGIHRGAGWDAIGCSKSLYPKTEDWPTDEETEKRMVPIMQNGGDGAHHNELELGSYLSAQDEVKQLRKEVDHLKKRLELEIKLKSKWKCRFNKSRPPRESIRTKKNQQALELIAKRESGDKTHSLADIGRLLDIKPGTLKNMAYMYRQSVKTKILEAK